MNRRGIAVVLGLLFAFGAGAHEGAPEAEKPPLENPGPPLAGAPEFAAGLAAHGGHLFTPEEMALVDQASRLFREAAAETDDSKRSRAEGLLLKLVTGLTPVLPVRLASGTAEMDTAAYHPLSGDTGALVLRVDAGGGPTRFVQATVDVEALPEPDAPLSIPYLPGGTTWALLNIERAPQGKSVLNVLFSPLDSATAPVLGALLIETPPQGNLKLAVLDEDGRPTPALVRLTSRKDGRLRRPANALDFAPQMDAIAGGPGNGPGLPEPLLLPQPVGGLYWCVPGPFGMALPVGDWEVHIHHGVEYEPVRDTFAIAEGATTDKSFRLRRWTKMAERGWYSGDDHVHSRLMSDSDAERLMAWAKAADIHVVNVLKMGNHMRTYYEQRGFGPGFRVQEGDRVLVPGQEDPRFIMGHAIGLNLTALVRDDSKYLLNDWVADEIHRQGGLYGHAHLSAVGPPLHAFNVQRDMTLLIPQAKSDFGSILQSFSLDTGFYYDFLNLGYKLTASSGTDTPYSSSIGASRVYAYLGDTPFTADAWFEAVRRGRTFVTNGPMVELRVEEALPGDELPVAENRPLRATARAWGLAGASAPAVLRLVRFGRVLEEAKPQPGADSVEVNTTLEAGYGSWVAAYVAGVDGTQAHTTPVYIVREGYRFWDIEQAEDLIRKREATLDEIEALLQGQQEKWSQGQINPMDFYNRRQAELAPQAVERVREIRPLYQELREVLAKERTERSNATPGG